MTSFSHAILAYDITLLAVYGLDFIAFSRRNDVVLAKWPLAAMVVLLGVGTIAVANDKMEFDLMGLLLLGAAAFGYANFLAFVKRGVTFSILSNHTRPPSERIPDAAFIAIDDRLHEMQGHGWAEPHDARWSLTAAGHRIARVRERLIRLLQIEAVG
jgi:hypothetical protein